ncbi:hypothetical protein DNJ73_06380 [Prochlorococcus marinus XMU1408]|uniref:Uncharacterized protein n=2 Tax=Prochlorococcus marinus TaxID=1219 RepID=A0A318R3W9_PROMR|nr:hypothetical protein [Prochlorococcus marinus str. XMU1408]PYE01704.1 hypothetical protein DNJ73_06380 [Prochlorococcus marinus XMU1408]
MRLIPIFLITIFLYLYIKFKRRKGFSNRKNLMERFKQRFKNINVRRKRISEEFTNSLLLDPSKNIPLGTWYSEDELREKADIHRTRLSKFGKSKINGEMLFVGPKGGIYKISDDGKKKYV